MYKSTERKISQKKAEEMLTCNKGTIDNQRNYYI